MTPATGAEAYAELRRTGRCALPAIMEPEDQHALTSSTRRLAKRDGLKVTQFRERPPGRGPHAFRHRSALILNLVHPDDPTTVVAPDRAVQS